MARNRISAALLAAVAAGTLAGSSSSYAARSKHEPAPQYALGSGSIANPNTRAQRHAQELAGESRGASRNSLTTDADVSRFFEHLQLNGN